MNKPTTAQWLCPIYLALLLPASGGWPGTVFAESYLDKSPDAVTETDLWEQYYGWRKDGEVAKAHEVALRLTATTARAHGEASTEFGMALAEVGVTKVLLDRHDEALADLVRAELILKERLPIYSEKLISALSFLASALQSSGRHDEALYAFTRAQHITHRLWGNNNEEQIRIVYAKADSFQALGDLWQAEQLHRHAYKLHRINFGASSAQAIAASAQLGTWLRSVGEYDRSVRHFHHALREIQGGGPDLPESYPLLYGMAHAYRGGYRGKHARGTYRRVLKVMATNPERFSASERIQAHLEFGDWLIQRYYEKAAVEQYLAAWHLADASGAERRRWLETLAAPELVRYEEMSPRDLDGANRFIRFQFDLTADGRPRRVKVTASGAGARERALARRMFPALTRYRPAIVDGEAVVLRRQTATMYLLPANTRLEPEPVADPQRPTQVDVVMN